MSDSKSTYSEVSKYYVNVTVPQNDIDRRRYVRSKDREKSGTRIGLRIRSMLMRLLIALYLKEIQRGHFTQKVE